MVSFLVAMCWVFFVDTDTVTRAFLATLTGVIFFIVAIVMVIEGAANGPEGSLRRWICLRALSLLQMLKYDYF